MPRPLLPFVLTVVGSPLTVSGSTLAPKDGPAQVVSRVTPTYPAQARREGIERGTEPCRPATLAAIDGLEEADRVEWTTGRHTTLHYGFFQAR